MEISEKSKVRRVKRIMKRTGLPKGDAMRFLELLHKNERFKAFKNKKWAFKLAKKRGLSIDEAMKHILKRKLDRAKDTSLNNLTGGEGDASSTIGDLETQDLEERMSDSDTYDNYDDDEDYTEEEEMDLEEEFSNLDNALVELEEEEEDDDFDGFDAKAFAKKNKTMLIVGGAVLILFFTKMGKDLVKKIM